MQNIKDTILIGDVAPFSIVDFPNHIAAVVFLQGCPWRCPFCYNKSLQTFEKSPDLIWDFEKLLGFLKRRKGVLDAVVFSGGEPLAQNNLKDAVTAVSELGYTIGLHTGGYNPKALEKVLPLIDWIGLDIKGPKEKYKTLTGGFNAFDDVIKSLQMIIKSGISFECRTTCDPRELNIEDLFSIGKFLNELGVREYYLQKYRPIKEDKTTTDSACEALISNRQLLDFFRHTFEKFEVRK